MSADTLVLTVALLAAVVSGGIGYGFSSITVPVALLFHTNRLLNPAPVLLEVGVNLVALVTNRRAPRSRVGLDFPVALRMQGWPVLVVGAGKVAEGRIEQLLEAGARVRLVAPEATEKLHALAREGKLDWRAREFAPGDCAGVRVAFTAADVPAVNARVVAEARTLGVLANAADQPELCDFHVPSIGRQGPITVAVSTAGLAPGLARRLRARVMAVIGPQDALLARLLGRARRRLAPGPERARVMRGLMDGAEGALGAGGGPRPSLRTKGGTS